MDAGMAQAVERIIGSDEVRSSILRSSTWRSLRLRARGIFYKRIEILRTEALRNTGEIMNKKKPLNTVIFDIGNVLIRFTSLDFIREKYGDDMGLRIANALYGEGRWPELDRGVMRIHEILQTFYDADPEIPKEYIDWSFNNISKAVQRCDYAIPWLKEVKKLGYRVLYLSNYSKHVMEARPEALDFLPVMDGGIFSCEVKLIKPDRAIYRLIEDRYCLDPERCLFIDDRQDNCEGAASIGMNYYCFKDYDTDRPEIMKILEEGRMTS